MIVQADLSNILEIESIYKDVILWMKKSGIHNLWKEEECCWDKLSSQYKLEDFYLCYREKQVTGCMAITDLDLTYWPQSTQGEALYLHKLAVKRQFSGKDISREMITFAKEETRRRRIGFLRLDCNKDNKKLCELYRRQGFDHVRDRKIEEHYVMSLLQCEVK